MNIFKSISIFSTRSTHIEIIFVIKVRRLRPKTNAFIIFFNVSALLYDPHTYLKGLENHINYNNE